MKQYVIDELRATDHKKLQSYLDERYGPPAMGSIYWMPIDLELLSNTQKAHRQCQPHCVALDLDASRLVCELLVRTRSRMRCDCIAYATPKQCGWLIALIDNIFNQLKIMT